MSKSRAISQEVIENQIFVIRGKKVMIDRDLAMLYDVQTKVLNQAVKKNADRFPEDFMFQLNNQEKLELVTNCDRLKRLKYATTKPSFPSQLIQVVRRIKNMRKNQPKKQKLKGRMRRLDQAPDWVAKHQRSNMNR